MNQPHDYGLGAMQGDPELAELIADFEQWADYFGLISSKEYGEKYPNAGRYPAAPMVTTFKKVLALLRRVHAAPAYTSTGQRPDRDYVAGLHRDIETLRAQLFAETEKRKRAEAELAHTIQHGVSAAQLADGFETGGQE